MNFIVFLSKILKKMRCSQTSGLHPLTPLGFANKFLSYRRSNYHKLCDYIYVESRCPPRAPLSKGPPLKNENVIFLKENNCPVRKLCIADPVPALQKIQVAYRKN